MVIDDSWNEFLSTLSDSDSEGVIAQLKCKLEDLMEKQAHIDQAKKAMFKPEFHLLLKHYLKKFELTELEKKMKAQSKNFEKAFGRDKFNHLKLLVRLKTMEDQKPKRRGLLAV